jgi:hypothetical protein
VRSIHPFRVAAVLSLLLLAARFVPAAYTDPSEGTYFLDAVNGDDANMGTSPETAWKSLSRLDSVRFKAGDVVLFKAGDVFQGSFWLQGSGTPENPVVFGAYGSGPKPRLESGASDREVIYITGESGLEFRNLEITNYHPAGSIPHRYGINIIGPPGSGDIRHLHFHNLNFIRIEGADPENESRAIEVEVLDNDADNLATRFNGFIVEDCFFSEIDGRAVQLNDRSQSLADHRLRGTNYYPTIGFVFQNNTGMNINRNLLQLGGTKDAVIQHNYMSGTEEGSAFWPFDAEGTLVQFNDFRHLRNENADSYICHFDYNCIDTLMQYNFGYDVDGGLIEVIVNSQFNGFQEDAVARYNIGIDVGFRDNGNAAGIFLTGRVTRSKVYNNTVVTTDLHGAYKAISVRNWGGEWPDNNEVTNNLFLATGSPSTFNNISRLAERGNVLSHNLYHGNMGVPSEDLSPVTGDPLLVNPSSREPWGTKLREGSAAIGAGKVIADNGGRDFFNNPVPADLVPSIGAHEFQTETGTEWAGFPVDENGWANTEDWLGWVNVANAPWILILNLDGYAWIPESAVSGAGGWLYVLKP